MRLRLRLSHPGSFLNQEHYSAWLRDESKENPHGKVRRIRANHDYDRPGALAYLAALRRQPGEDLPI
ncbi:MAG: hypothetical protein ACRDS9_18080 [Pseudonocardiaceae bacterium]